jgi:hypothetical protein
VDVEEEWYVQRDVRFEFDFSWTEFGAIRSEDDRAPKEWIVDLRFRRGFHDYVDNHELAAHFLGRPGCYGEPIAIDDIIDVRDAGPGRDPSSTSVSVRRGMETAR